MPKRFGSTFLTRDEKMLRHKAVDLLCGRKMAHDIHQKQIIFQLVDLICESLREVLCLSSQLFSNFLLRSGLLYGGRAPEEFDAFG